MARDNSGGAPGLNTRTWPGDRGLGLGNQRTDRVTASDPNDAGRIVSDLLRDGKLVRAFPASANAEDWRIVVEAFEDPEAR